MTRKECEQQLAKKMWEMVRILKQYAPECEYFAASYDDRIDTALITFNNAYWDEDKYHPVNFSQWEKDNPINIQRDNLTGRFTVTQGNELLGEHLDYDELIGVIEMNMVGEGHSR